MKLSKVSISFKSIQKFYNLYRKLKLNNIYYNNINNYVYSRVT